MSPDEMRLAIYRLMLAWTVLIGVLVLLGVPFWLRIGIGVWRALDAADMQADVRAQREERNWEELQAELDRLRGWSR